MAKADYCWWRGAELRNMCTGDNFSDPSQDFVQNNSIFIATTVNRQSLDVLYKEANSSSQEVVDRLNENPDDYWTLDQVRHEINNLYLRKFA